VSTLDWLAFVARRRESARLLVIGTYRPVDVLVQGHPLRMVKQELQTRGYCTELLLDFLNEEDMEKYLAVRFAFSAPVREAARGGEAPRTSLQRLARLIHRRTDGNPLFMVNVVHDLLARGVLAQSEGRWELKGEAEEVAAGVPENLQQLIAQQLERLSPETQCLLEVASVVGAEFSAAAVAAGMEREVDGIEEQCEALVRQKHFLRASGTAEWPDETVAARYGFLHALYQDVLYQRLTVRRRRRLHQQIGERVEQAYGARAREIAAELAVHFEQGGSYRQAVQYLEQAGMNALRRNAHQEAVALLAKGLELLKTLPDTPERAQEELTLQVTLGATLIATKGYGAPEVEQAYTRARVLCQAVGETPQLFLALWGLWAFYNVRAEFQAAHELAEQCLHLAQRVQDPGLLLEAYVALGSTLLWRGEFAPARAYLEQGIALYDPQQHSAHAFLYGQDPGMWCLTFAARALSRLCYPDQALKRADEALTLAQELAQPHSLAAALVQAGLVHLFRREGQLSQKYAEAGIALATEQGFPFWVAYGTLLQGWALAEQGQSEEGIVQMRRSWAATQATGAGLFRPYFLARLAEAYGIEGRTEEGLNTISEALAAVDKTGERGDEAELYRLKGELTLTQSSVQSLTSSVPTNQKAKGKNQKAKITNPQTLTPDLQAEVEAEACFLKAIEIAQKQQAKSLELCATVSLARLWQQQGKRGEAHTMLSEIYHWFIEGFDTKDLQEAKALIEELG
jgi:predicted ATPase